ncbi:MAG TPA: hypothetical protein VMF53_11925 [Alphaproteobacteria bacterium]|nr:hypothetical protein [Alphaproteobacteria bacterium]
MAGEKEDAAARAEPPYDGVPVRLGTREWIVPALNLRQLRRLAPKFALLGSVGAGMGEEQIDALVEIAHAALGRNYPTLTEDQVAELIDLANAGTLVKAIVGVSGLTQGPRAGRDRAGPGDGTVGEASAGRAPAAIPPATPPTTQTPTPASTPASDSFPASAPSASTPDQTSATGSTGTA